MYYNLSKTAELLGLTTGDVNRLREQGKLRAYRDGSDWKFRKEEVEQYLTNMIKERSGQSDADSLLSTEDDDEATKLADSAMFDAMFDQAGDDLEVTAKEDAQVKVSDDGMTPAVDDEPPAVDDETPAVDDETPVDDDLVLAPEDDDLVLASDEESGDSSVQAADATEEKPTDQVQDESDSLTPQPEDESSDVFAIADAGASEEVAPEDALIDFGDSPLTSEDSALAEDVSPTGSGSGTGSGSNLNLDSDSGISLLGGSDSGISLLDVSGSDVDLAGDDIVLGGGSGSSGGLDLGSDSGIALMSDSDGGFELDAAIQEQGELGLAPIGDDDDSVFQLEGESSTPSDPAQILSLDQRADSEAPTELAADESVFELSTDSTDVKAATDPSSSIFMTEAGSSESASPFLSDDSVADDDGGIFGLAEEPDVPPLGDGDSTSESRSIDILDEPSSEASTDQFLSADSSDSPFGAPSSDVSPFADPSSGIAMDDSSGAADMFAADAFSAAPAAEFGGPPEFGGETPTFGAQTKPLAQATSSTQFTGKDLIYLVPCLIFLILATIGALELCRTIWSYQEGTFEVGGPILEAIAKMVKLI
jgi:excisionase family DNA binding protein